MRGIKAPPWNSLPERSAPGYYDLAMKAGNKLRKNLDQNFAMVALGIELIRKKRRIKGPERRAYIIRSLKRPEEVELLRTVYGPAAFVVSVYSPRKDRVDRMASILAENAHLNTKGAMPPEAEALINRDENENNDKYGQRLRKTFPLGDIFVDASSQEQVRKVLDRFVRLIFGDMWLTPTVDEQGMAIAYLARIRSASPARQVGAALTTDRGDVLSIGTNEAAKAGASSRVAKRHPFRHN